MFDIWWGEMELTTLILVFSIAVLLPLQLFLCFKVKSRAVRLLPVIIFSGLTAVLVILALVNQGWDGLGYALLAIFTGFMLLVCGIVWGIWVIINRIKAKQN